MTIVLIGPPAAGKTTAAGVVARALCRDVVHVDMNRAQRYAPFGYTAARADRLFEEGGARALHRYEARFEARVLAQEAGRHPEAVLDTGGGLLLQYADADVRRVGDALAAADVTVLVLPHAGDPERSTRCLLARVRARGGGDASTVEWLDRGGESLLRALVRAGQAHLPVVDLVLDTAGPVPAVIPGGRRPGTPPADRIATALVDRPVRAVGR
ncbi:nucleoside/nucleotide kinase family protein [Streptomyces kanasensis]|uniref:hypothetical protein n=1 Tax=Streptomyces kanasensis TaxID=936756 RepID=UPI00382E7F7E